MDVIASANLAVGLPDKVEKPRIHLGRLVLAPVAQKPVQLVQTRFHIAAVFLENDLRLLAGMDVVEFQRTRLGPCLRAHRAQKAGAHQQACKKQAQETRRVCRKMSPSRICQINRLEDLSASPDHPAAQAVDDRPEWLTSAYYSQMRSNHGKNATRSTILFAMVNKALICSADTMAHLQFRRIDPDQNQDAMRGARSASGSMPYSFSLR